MTSAGSIDASAPDATGERVEFSRLAGVIRAHPGPVDGARRVAAVDGLSGAGKTSFAARLAMELGAPCLSTDELVPGWDGLAESVELLVRWVLAPLARGQRARWRRYDWVAGRPAEWVELAPGELLVVEGCCVGLPATAPFLSFLVWIEAPADERRRRLEQRSDWPAYAPHAESWARQEEILQAGARTRERADLVVDNSGRGGDDWCGRSWLLGRWQGRHQAGEAGTPRDIRRDGRAPH